MKNARSSNGVERVAAMLIRYTAIHTYVLAFAVLASCGREQGTSTGGDIRSPWVMHHIDDSLWNHNSLSPGDVNRDGYTDFCVIHEGPDVYSIVLHPGRDGNVRSRWQKIIVESGANVEYGTLGDFDGDGNLDIAGVEGLSRKGPSGVRLIWGPGPEEVADSSQWESAGLVPGTEGMGHYLYVRDFDVDGDGNPDIVTGGRVLRTNGRIGGIRWIRAPALREERRDLSKWKIFAIDSTLLSGHGFRFADLDNDGDQDIVVANPDWNTPPESQGVLWYENPGPGNPAQRKHWPRHVIAMRNEELFSKAQVAVGDLDANGWKDVAVPSFNHIFAFLQTSRNTWKQIVISRPEHTRWVPRPLKFADLDQDGRLDIVGMLIHNFGYMPQGKSTVFWMEQGNDPIGDPGSWMTHTIKSGGEFSTNRKWNGEKWDHLRFVDIDNDGDDDIIGNCEEYYELSDGHRDTLLGVVWFENPLK